MRPERLRSAWASAQSDQSLCCTLNGQLKTQGFFMQTPNWVDAEANVCVFVGRTSHFVGFVGLRLSLYHV